MRRRYSISQEDFCVLWNSCRSLPEFCQRSGMPAAAAKARASFYRIRGVNLQLFAPGNAPLDVVSINRRLAQEVNQST